MPMWTDWLVMLGAVTYLVIALTETEGPFNLFERARETPVIGKLFECPICASIWVALLVQWLYPQLPFVVYALALAGLFVAIGRVWERATAAKKVQADREKIASAEELLGTILALGDERLGRAVIEHYLGGVDLAVAVYLGMRDEKQEPTEPS